jgi:hypothetical protein
MLLILTSSRAWEHHESRDGFLGASCGFDFPSLHRELDVLHLIWPRRMNWSNYNTNTPHEVRHVLCGNLHASHLWFLISFFGGYRFFGLEQVSAFLAIAVIVFKAFIGYWIIMWIKYTLLRIRIDHMLGFNWKFLTPLAFVLLMVVALLNALLAGTPPFLYYGSDVPGEYRPRLDCAGDCSFLQPQGT